MNAHDNQQPGIDAEVLDLLVDGELPDAQRRDLLTSLDRVPEGWRACALAFLEAQCLKQACGAVIREQVTLSPPPATPRRLSRARRILTNGIIAFAVAASFLMAVGLGWMLQQGRHSGGLSAPGAAQTAAASGGSRQEGNQARGPRGAFDGLPQKSLALEAVPRPWGTVTVALPGTGDEGTKTVSLPVTESDHVDESWFRPSPDALPAGVRAALRGMGYQIRQERHLLPVPLEGGNRLVMPVDQVELRYVGNPAY